MNARTPLISQSEYARRRGVAKSAVAKAVAEGRITLIDGKVNEQVANIQWEQNTRARADSSRTSAAQAVGEGGGAPATAQPPASPDTAPAPAPATGYNDFRTRREAAEAERAEFELAKLRGRLVDRDLVERSVFDAFRALRDAVFNAPQRAAPRVIGVADARDIEVVLTEELRKAFDGWEARMQERLPPKEGIA